MHAQLHFASVSTLLLLSAMCLHRANTKPSQHRNERCRLGEDLRDRLRRSDEASMPTLYERLRERIQRRLAPPPVLLKRSLRQRESWWVNGYGGSAPVSSIVREFIGVPKDLVRRRRSLRDRHRLRPATIARTDAACSGSTPIAKPATVIFVGEDFDRRKSQRRRLATTSGSTPAARSSNFEYAGRATR